MQDAATIRNKMLRYERMAHKALIELGKAYEASAVAIQENTRLNGTDAAWNTYLLDVIFNELDAIQDIGERSQSKMRIGAILCASAEDLLAIRKAQGLPPHPNEHGLASENMYYRHNSLWAKQEQARYAKRATARRMVPIV